MKNINRELERYSPELASRPQIILANKCDALDEDAVDIAAFEAFVDENEWEMLYVSAATGENLDNMIQLVDERLRLLPPIKVYEGEMEAESAVVSDGKQTTIRRENETFYVEGEWLYNLMGQINFDDYESLNYFQNVLKRNGIFELLESRGCTDGHTVSIYDFEFDYVK